MMLIAHTRSIYRLETRVLATAPDRAETSRLGGPMHDRTYLEVLQHLLYDSATCTRLPLDSFVPHESTLGDLIDAAARQDSDRGAAVTRLRDQTLAWLYVPIRIPMLLVGIACASEC